MFFFMFIFVFFDNKSNGVDFNGVVLYNWPYAKWQGSQRLRSHPGMSGLTGNSKKSDNLNPIIYAEITFDWYHKG